jgi:hypothetical protein
MNGERENEWKFYFEDFQESDNYDQLIYPFFYEEQKHNIS